MVDELTGVAIVAFTVAAVAWLGRQELPLLRSLLQWFPAILFAYVIPALFTHALGLDLGGLTLHAVSRDWIIPLAIVTVMSALPFAQLRVVGVRPLVVFVAGSAAIATLPVLLVYAFVAADSANEQLFLIDEYWKGLVPIVGGWIGGSTSQLVLKEVIGTEEALFLSVLVLDNILVNIWTILMFQFIRRTPRLNSALRIRDEIRLLPPKAEGAATLQPWVVACVLAGIVLAANALRLDFLWKVIGLSLVGLLLVNGLRSWNVSFVLRLGGILIVLIMAILGLRLNFSNFSLPLELVVLVVIWLLLHYLCMLLDLMPHAILLAILSMVTGTAWGLLTIQLFASVFSL